MKLLIVYATTEGQTRKIAEFVKTEAEKKGVEVTLCDATAGPVSPDGYDAAVIAASLHMMRYQTSIADYIRRHAGMLNDMPSAFVSVSLSAAAEGYDEVSFRELKEITAKFLGFTRWNPAFVEFTAGALLYTQYDYFKKFIVRQISLHDQGNADASGDHEYTNWVKLRVFVDSFLTHAKVTASKLSDEIL